MKNIEKQGLFQTKRFLACSPEDIDDFRDALLNLYLKVLRN